MDAGGEGDGGWGGPGRRVTCHVALCDLPAVALSIPLEELLAEPRDGSAAGGPGEPVGRVDRAKARALVRRAYGQTVPVEKLRILVGGREAGCRGAALPLRELAAGWLRVDALGRLLGGKGGFGANLRGRKGARKKGCNIDACRDEHGQRLRHARAATRIAEWAQRKKQDDELVAALGDGKELEAGRPKPPAPLLDRSYDRALRRNQKTLTKIVRDGMVHAAYKPPQPASVPPSRLLGQYEDDMWGEDESASDKGSDK